MEDQIKTYLTLLLDATTKKENKLNELILETIKQSNCFRQDEFDEEAYEKQYQVKTALIEEITLLDEGFGTLFERIKDEVKANQQAYETEIKALQAKIRSVTDKTVRVQRLESENKARFEAYLTTHKKKIKDYSVSKKSAAAYYKNMMQQFSNDSAFYNKSN